MLVRLSQSIEERLERLALRKRLTKASYVRQVILKHIEDQEDAHEADRILRRVRAGKESTLSLAEAAERLGLE